MSTSKLQFIVASATIADPAAHLQALTGCDFEVVSEVDNGAPFHGLTMLHVDGPQYGAPAEAMASELLSPLATQMPTDMAFIAFVESRQGCERIARTIDRDGVVAYRSGYNAADRRGIERELRRGSLRGTVSTSALELGIDIPQFAIGFNVGVPQTRKAFRQRVGRIGRSRAGVFAVMAPPSAFAQLGSSFREYFEGPVEPSPLYLDNLYIQFQQACCYRDEASVFNGAALSEDTSDFPASFMGLVAASQPGALRPRELDATAAIGMDSPHIAYSLRRMSEVSFALKHARTADIIGTIDHDKALREAHPGAIYYHMGKPNRVIEWRSNAYEHSILLQPIARAEPTKAIMRTLVSISLDSSELIDERLLLGSEGALAEVRLRVAESVEGYRSGSANILFKELRDSRMSRKQREFNTTGVVMRIGAPWFAGSTEHQLAARRAVANAFEVLLAREYGIARGDIRTAHSGIALYERGGARKIDDAIAVFDSVAGGLRLSAPIFHDVGLFLDRFERAASLAGADALISAALVERLRDWHASLSNATAAAVEEPPIVGDEEIIIYAPQSEVGVRFRGRLLERRLLEPQFVATAQGEHLMYRYEMNPGVQAWVAHDQVEPIGHDWRRAIWNPVTNELRELDS